MEMSHDTIPFKYSRWMILSSMSFMVPFFAAFHHHQYVSSIIYASMCIASINFWRKPIYGIRRNIDMIVAGSAYLHGGWCSTYIYNINNPKVIIAMSIPILYLASKRLNKYPPYWVYVHFTLHIISSGACYLVVNDKKIIE